MLEPNNCKNMEHIRDAIDTIDKEIVKLIAQRAKYVYKASEFKTSKEAVKDSKRVKEVIASKKNLAKQYEVSPLLIEILYEKMIEHFINEEMEQWKKKKNIKSL